jgi:hypothetical protein
VPRELRDVFTSPIFLVERSTPLPLGRMSDFQCIELPGRNRECPFPHANGEGEKEGEVKWGRSVSPEELASWW